MSAIRSVRGTILDRLPPHALEIEKAIIGCCLIDPKTCVPQAQLTITSREFFYDLSCQVSWDALCSFDASKLNLISLFQKLLTGTDEQRAVAGHSEFLSECEGKVSSTAYLPEWLEEIQKKKIARDILQACVETCAQVYGDHDTMQVLEGFESRALGIRPTSRNSKDIKALLNEAIPLLEARAGNWDLITGLSYGIPDVDRLTDGMHPGEFVVIGAPTSCGKTAMALGIVMHNVLAGVPGAFASAEMLPVRLVIRALCSESRVNFRQIAERDVMKMMASIGKIGASPLYIESVSGFTIGQVRALARRLVQQYGIKIFAVENIQLLIGEGDNREQRIANISSGMKGIALELGITVIGLSQLNEDGKLRESRAISHDADTALILSNDGEWCSVDQPMILNVEKCRDGETGIVPLILFKTFTRFEQASKFSIASEDIPNNPHND